MNQPAPRELCEKLQTMGCVSESDWFYPANDPDRVEPICYEQLIFDSGSPKIFCFEQNDFTGATERARENSIIAFGDGPVNDDCPACAGKPEDLDGHLMSAFDFHRHAMIDLPWTERISWFEYLEREMRK